MSVPNNKLAGQARRVVLYARVSSKEQREEGYSIEAQVRLLRDFAVKQGFVIDGEFIDVESASKSGRTGFNAMLAYLQKHPACRVILVEKTDRLYRNLRDYATLDVKDWGLTIHLVKEGEVLSPDSPSGPSVPIVLIFTASGYAAGTQPGVMVAVN
jgi:DNA invertase Pin-like site-specific DNA recombinase